MPSAQSDDEKIRWYLIAAFIADLAGFLNEDKDLKLASLTVEFAGGAPWRAIVAQELGVDSETVGHIYSACRNGMNPASAMTFVLRGLGCPDPEARLSEVVGQAIDEQ